MTKPPGVLALLVTAVTGFGRHLAELAAAPKEPNGEEGVTA
jgi:hypothetical protein